MLSRRPGIGCTPTTDLAVLPDYRLRLDNRAPSFSQWLGSIPLWVPLLGCAILIVWPLAAQAQAEGSDTNNPLAALARWAPLLLSRGFLTTVLISLLTMFIGTVLGVILGVMRSSPSAIWRWPAHVLTVVFRNSPWLVLLFIVMLSLPFELHIFGQTIPFPGWMKAVIGLTLPIMANISEIVLGAIRSVPNAQWEAAESLAFTRRQTMYQIILPQCIKRMIPPWMNWYAILTMATPVVSILGVDEFLGMTRRAIEAEGSPPELLIPFYGFVLLVFFLYCYPIARLTMRLERRYAVKF